MISSYLVEIYEKLKDTTLKRDNKNNQQADSQKLDIFYEIVWIVEYQVAVNIAFRFYYAEWTVIFW